MKKNTRSILIFGTLGFLLILLYVLYFHTSYFDILK